MTQETLLVTGAAGGVGSTARVAIGILLEQGPQSLTMAGFAQELSGALGRTISYVNLPPEIWEAKLPEAHFPAHLTAHLLAMARLHRENRYGRMTDTFQRLVGRPPISAAEFARRHAAAFTPP